jgi:hypothetical protein
MHPQPLQNFITGWIYLASGFAQILTLGLWQPSWVIARANYLIRLRSHSHIVFGKN